MIDTSKMIGKVEEILIKWPQSRNDDKYLIAAVIGQFYRHLTKVDAENKRYIYLVDIMNLPSTETIRRIRCKFQEEGKYLAKEEVKEARDERAEQVRIDIVNPIREINIFDL